MRGRMVTDVRAGARRPASGYSPRPALGNSDGTHASQDERCERMGKELALELEGATQFALFATRAYEHGDHPERTEPDRKRSPCRSTAEVDMRMNLDVFGMFPSVDAGRTARTRRLRCSSAAAGIRTAKAPAKGLSTLNSKAFGLAVYASQCGLPTPHARLASSRWSDFTGPAFRPQGSDERFQSVNYISSSSPKLAFASGGHGGAPHFEKQGAI